LLYKDNIILPQKFNIHQISSFLFQAYVIVSSIE